MSAKIPEISPIPKPEKPYEEFHEGFTRYNYATESYETYSVGDRVQLRSKHWHTKFMQNYGILEGHVGKITQIKRCFSSGTIVWKIYIRNPLWNYELPDKDPCLMEFYEHEFGKIEDL